MEDLKSSCYSEDFDFDKLQRHLLILADVIKQGTPTVRKVTSIHTICQAMNAETVFKSMVSEVHKLIRLFQ